jgi:hypothetical protein
MSMDKLALANGKSRLDERLLIPHIARLSRASLPARDLTSLCLTFLDLFTAPRFPFSFGSRWSV